MHSEYVYLEDPVSDKNDHAGIDVEVALYRIFRMPVILQKLYFNITIAHILKNYQDLEKGIRLCNL